MYQAWTAREYTGACLRHAVPPSMLAARFLSTASVVGHKDRITRVFHTGPYIFSCSDDTTLKVRFMRKTFLRAKDMVHFHFSFAPHNKIWCWPNHQHVFGIACRTKQTGSLPPRHCWGLLYRELVQFTQFTYTRGNKCLVQPMWRVPNGRLKVGQ